MPKLIKICTDFGFAGTDEEKIIRVSDNADLQIIEIEEMSSMTDLLTCTVEEIDEDEIDEDEIDEDWS